METCQLIIGYIDKKDLKKIEILYKLQKAVDKLEHSLESDKANISKNAQEFAAIYQNTRYDCSSDNTDGYCNELKVFEQYINQCMKSDKHTEAWEILKTLVPNDGTSIIVSFIMIFGIPFFLYILYKVNKYNVQIYSYFSQYI